MKPRHRAAALADLRQPTITYHASRAGAFRFRRVVRLPSIATCRPSYSYPALFQATAMPIEPFHPDRRHSYCGARSAIRLRCWAQDWRRRQKNEQNL